MVNVLPLSCYVTKKQKSGTSEDHPREAQKASTLGTMPWGAKDSSLSWELLTQVEKPENFKVIFGKKKGKV
jgi:hypothetical protein